MATAAYSLRYRLLDRWPLILGAAAVVAIAGVAVVLLLSGNEDSDTAAPVAEDSTLSESEAATVSGYARAIRSYCLKTGYALDPQYGFASNRARAIAEGKAAEAVRGLQTAYRDHPDATLPSGESMRQVMADTITVLREGGPAENGLSIQSDCAPGDASILERELTATP